MVCFVHDRQSLSQFHATVNKLRRTNEFHTMTLRQLPRQCCSCPGKRKDMACGETEPLLTSMDFDALRLVCLQLDLKQCISTNDAGSSRKIRHQQILRKQKAAERPVARLFQRREESSRDSEDLVENVLVYSQARLQFLCNRFDNSSKRRQPRTHRRQHILALALTA